MSDYSRNESDRNRDSNRRRQGGFNDQNGRGSSSGRSSGKNSRGERSYGQLNSSDRSNSRDGQRSNGFRNGEDRNDGYRSNRSDGRSSGYGRDRRDDRREDRGGFGGNRRRDSDRNDRNERRDNNQSRDRRDYRDDRRDGGRRENHGGFGGRRNDDRRSDRSNRFNKDRRDDRREDRGFDKKRSYNSDNRNGGGHQRGGQQRRDARDSAMAPRDGYRPSKPQGPEIDTDVTGRELDGFVMRQLRALEKENAEVVGQHLVMAGRYLNIDPKFALEHATAATRRAGRIAVVREAAGIAAYAAEDFEMALRELRTHRRISGSNEHLAVIVDTERALGRIEKALELAEESKTLELEPAVRVELAIVVSGIKHDQGDLQAALKALEIPELNSKRGFDYSPRLFESYGELLEEDGREKEALRWYRLAVMTEAALGQGDYAEPEIFDIFDEEELLEPEERSVDLEEIHEASDKIAQTEDLSDLEEEDEEEEATLGSSDSVISKEQAEEENLQSFDHASSAHETETSELTEED